jgi:ABC-type nickel/cobalt efflux system permease component RcnA
MSGLDDWIAGLSQGGSIAVVLGVAVLLGLRHATDPDHLAAVTTLVASRPDGVRGASARLGLWWGAGHALTLVLFGLPILLAQRFLSEPLQRGAESAVAGLIIFLAIRLLVRWRHGFFSLHAHPDTDPAHRHRVRTPAGAFGIGLAHGVGGSAGVGVLLLAAIPSRGLAIVSLLVLAVFTAVSMVIVTVGFGAGLQWRPVSGSMAVLAPAMGVASLGFGAWYAAAAWSLAPYPF